MTVLTKFKKRSPGKRVLQCLSVNKLVTAAGGRTPRNNRIEPDATESCGAKAQKHNAKPAHNKEGGGPKACAENQESDEFERLLEWENEDDKIALISQSAGANLTVAVSTNLDDSIANTTNYATIDYPLGGMEGTVISALTADNVVTAAKTTTITNNVNEERKKNDDKGAFHSEAYKTLQQLESVQADLRKAVHAMVSVRTKSEATRPLLPHETADLRKDVQTVQSCVTLAKDQVDEMCTEWHQTQTLPVAVGSSGVVHSNNGKNNDSKICASTEQLVNVLSKMSSASAQAMRVKLQEKLNRERAAAAKNCGAAGSRDHKDIKDEYGRFSTDASKNQQSSSSNAACATRASGMGSISVASTSSSSSPSGGVSNKELLALRAERDGLVRTNQTLVSTLNTVMKELEEAEERVQGMAGTGERVDNHVTTKSMRGATGDEDDEFDLLLGGVEDCIAGNSNSNPSADSAVPPEPNRLVKTIHLLTSNVKALMEEKDRLALELQTVNQSLLSTRHQKEQMQSENASLELKLQHTQEQLQQAYSSNDQQILATAHGGRVMSASLVFTNSELAHAKKRIQELENTVLRLNNNNNKTHQQQAPASDKENANADKPDEEERSI